LLAWYDHARRDLPWREYPDFYRVWISEIMLQQTRVEAVIPYYRQFLARFPSIESLAAASEHDVLALWSGLGYYSRARNLHRAAKWMAANGLPATYDAVRALPGIGPYTAAAIASIAFGLPYAAVDGNVLRVMSRLTNDGSDVGSSAARRTFAERAQALLDRRRPGDFNQAMMELGATVCLPRAPLCNSCPAARFCAARTAGTERELPVKASKPRARGVDLDLALLERDSRIFLIQRPRGESRLAEFWELPRAQLFPDAPRTKLCEFRHRIVNDNYRVTVWRVASDPTIDAKGGWFEIAGLDRVPLATIARKALHRRAHGRATSNAAAG
jgi:A/G-specific adenine glycosylase